MGSQGMPFCLANQRRQGWKIIFFSGQVEKSRSRGFFQSGMPYHPSSRSGPRTRAHWLFSCSAIPCSSNTCISYVDLTCKKGLNVPPRRYNSYQPMSHESKLHVCHLLPLTFASLLLQSRWNLPSGSFWLFTPTAVSP